MHACVARSQVVWCHMVDPVPACTLPLPMPGCLSQSQVTYILHQGRRLAQADVLQPSVVSPKRSTGLAYRISPITNRSRIYNKITCCAWESHVEHKKSACCFKHNHYMATAGERKYHPHHAFTSMPAIFSSFVLSVDGLMARKARSAVMHMASKLATKWGRSYCEVMGSHWVQSPLSFTILRATNRCVHRPRVSVVDEWFDTGLAMIMHLSGTGHRCLFINYLVRIVLLSLLCFTVFFMFCIVFWLVYIL